MQDSFDIYNYLQRNLILMDLNNKLNIYTNKIIELSLYNSK